MGNPGQARGLERQLKAQRKLTNIEVEDRSVGLLQNCARVDDALITLLFDASDATSVLIGALTHS